jgi:type IV secretion system protein VirD4
MMTTRHLGEAGPHPVVASTARELLNKSDNERSGVLSTAMSFLGLYRDPVVADVTRRCDWRIADLVADRAPATLYLVAPPSDISRTKPLIRLVLNQIGRRLTEDLHAKDHRHRLLMMLDEFPALGRLDFFESALAFMAGYGIKAFLIAQSLNQIERAYGPNNAILDNCHVRVSFATNDERTAKRVSDALGAATEMKAMKNYAGSRLSPWLGHLMVSRSETARPLLTPGEVMQLPPHRRDRHGGRLSAGAGEESPLLRRPTIRRARSTAARSPILRSLVTGRWLVAPAAAQPRSRLVGRNRESRGRRRQRRPAPRTRPSRACRHRRETA